jgi:hypothetical protein
VVVDDPSAVPDRFAAPCSATTSETSIVWGVFVATESATVIVAVCAPTDRPVWSTATVSVEGAVPEVGEIDSHGWSTVAVQLRVSPPTFVMLTVWVATGARRTPMALPDPAAAPDRAGASGISVTTLPPPVIAVVANAPRARVVVGSPPPEITTGQLRPLRDAVTMMLPPDVSAIRNPVL